MSEEEKTEETTGGILNWDSPIDPTQKDREYVLLPKGKAFFSIVKLDKERKQFGKFGVIPVAVVHLKVTSAEDGAPDETGDIALNLGLHSDLAWKITEFFTELGQRKHGDKGKFVADWNKIIGESGKCILSVRDMIAKKSQKKYQVNDIAKFGWPEEKEESQEDDGGVKF